MTTKPKTEPVPPQKLQGALTYSGIAVAAMAFALQSSGMVPPGLDPTAVAAGVVGFAAAVYGRWRRDRRPG